MTLIMITNLMKTKLSLTHWPSSKVTWINMVPAPIATLGNLQMASSVIFQEYCVLHHFHKDPPMPNSRIHWYLQEGDAFLPLEFCISKVFLSNNVIRARFHAKFPFFLIFSGICWPSWPGLSSEFLKSVSELPTTCYKRSIKSVSEVPNTKER